MFSTKDIKVKFLGITPEWVDDTGTISPQQLVALSGLLTYSGKSVDEILRELRDSGKDLDKKVAAILRQSSLKGHASMATTPAFSFSYEASKFIDSALTGIVFASAIMASGRRTDTTADDIVAPEGIAAMPDSLALYRKTSERNIEVLNHLLANGVGKDEASKVLQYGIYGTGIIQFSVESLVTLKREYEAQKEWMPEDVGILISTIENNLRDCGVDLLYATRLAAPRNNYPYPNIFKDPRQTNLARELAPTVKSGDNFKIISADFLVTEGLKKRLRDLEQKIGQAVQSGLDLREKWPKLLEARQQIARDYLTAANIKIFSSSAWRVWGDKKRHRTVSMVVDSVYWSAARAREVLARHKKRIAEKKLNHAAVDEIDAVFSVPPAIAADREFLHEYLERALDSLETYAKLVEMGIKERDAIFVVPRGLKLDMAQDYNLYNLIAGYYPLRICSTAEEELRRSSIKEVTAIKNLLQEKGLDWLGRHIVPKCHCVGFCLEQNSCGMVKSLNKNYDADIHKQIHADLEAKFQQNLENL